MGWFRADFVRFSAVLSRWRSTSAIYNTVSADCPIWTSFQACFRLVIRHRLPFCGWWWVLSPSGCRLLWSSFGRSGAIEVIYYMYKCCVYMYICCIRYSVAFATFFNLLCINCITLFTLCIISILLFSYLYQNNAVITISSGYYCILSICIKLSRYHCTITYNTIVPLYRVQSSDCITIYLQIVSTDCINLSFI